MTGGAALRMPAEWAPHERTLMGWPCRRELWGARLDEARDAYAAIAGVIAGFEPVTMLANPEDAADAASRCGAAVSVLAVPLDDSWVRDSGPILVCGEGAGRVGMDFAFNAWGGKYPPWDRDAASAAAVLAQLGIARSTDPMVLEGGAISVDGEGTLVTTEQCLLNPNRNPAMSRADVEARLRGTLGVDVVIWLDQGLVEDRDTDGHVDNVCMFTAPGQVVLQTVTDPSDPNFANVEENRCRLADARDAAGRAVHVTEIDALPRVEMDGEPLVCPYTNFYVCNGAVIVPTTGAATDAEMLARIGAEFPGREVVAVDGAILAKGGGGAHCITQQIPVCERTGERNGKYLS